MANVIVETAGGDVSHPHSLVHKLESLAERVRDRAYDIFHRHKKHGRAIDDWLQAERDLIFAPPSELIEKNGDFEIRVAAPGFAADQAVVTALPDAVIVSAESSHRHEEKDANVHFCEFGTKTLYRRIDLPAAIDTDRVTASLDDGILHITAHKTA
jgi:HSP20 family protein